MSDIAHMGHNPTGHFGGAMDGDVDRERRLAELDAAFHAMALEPRVGLTAAEVNAQWRRLSRQHHPDFGGSNDRMAQINAARDTILAEIEADGLSNHAVGAPAPEGGRGSRGGDTRRRQRRRAGVRRS